MSRPVRPHELGRFEVVAKIAGGGLSTIYLGRTRDPKRIGDETPVALKVVRHDLRDDDEITTMFLDEARLLRRLVHPNIVRTLESGTGEGCAFIAMELLFGMSLSSVQRACAARNLGLHPEAIAYVGARVADALHYAHALTGDDGTPLRVVHRDVNPENVFLGFDGDVKLLDFGLAKSTARSRESMPGMLMGKLPYLSPEQVMQLPLDGRSDIFGLGTTLWEMCTMRRLFRRLDDVGTVNAVHRGPIPDPRLFASDVPDGLAHVILRALERNRTRRYSTAGSLARALDALLGPDRVASAGRSIASMMRDLFPLEVKRQEGWRKPPPGRTCQRAAMQ
jgi:eukaryotic-like serine/threonine-protein kinase